MRSLTLDTGALIALERGEKRMHVISKAARLAETVMIAPAPVITQWWRGSQRSGRHSPREILKTIHVEPVDARLAKIAGEAIAATPSTKDAVDAIVMASAAQRGDIVYTSDLGDLELLRHYFPDVRVLRA